MSITNLADLNLHYILRTIVADDTFLLKNNEIVLEKTVNKPAKIPILNLISDVKSINLRLPAYQKQSYDLLPMFMQSILLPTYYRFGIYHSYEKKMDTIQMSFLNALNMCIRPELTTYDFATQVIAFENFETFITTHIQHNYHIDKTKNTKKVKAINANLVQELKSGMICDDILNYIVNILEINLVIFDLTTSSKSLYWTHSVSYPQFNYFRNIIFLIHTGGNYEPVLHPTNLTIEERMRIYGNIFNDLKNFNVESKFNMDIASLMIIHPYVSIQTFTDLYKYNMKIPDKSKCLEKLKQIE
jgi:hypothetical protein